MSEIEGRLQAGGETLAWRRVEGAGPTVVWLGGFRSDMMGGKAQALADWAQRNGRGFLRFDYSAHGASSGDFLQGTITHWRADVLAVIDQLTQGPLVLAGSSMGGWLACLAAMARPQRLAGLVLLAPAADFPQALIAPRLDEAARRDLVEHGVWMRPSAYGSPDPITRAFLDDAARWCVLPGPLRLGVPVRILQGGADADVPWRHALALAEAIEDEDLIFTLIRDGDHRLSRPQDLARMVAAVEGMGG